MFLLKRNCVFLQALEYFQVRVGSVDAGALSVLGDAITTNSRCDGLKSYDASLTQLVEGFPTIVFECVPPIKGKFMTAQKLWDQPSYVLEIVELTVYRGERMLTWLWGLCKCIFFLQRMPVLLNKYQQRLWRIECT